jgi:hypothetical protein
MRERSAWETMKFDNSRHVSEEGAAAPSICLLAQFVRLRLPTIPDQRAIALHEPGPVSQIKFKPGDLPPLDRYILAPLL